MAARSDAWFRRVGTVSLTTSGGSQVQGFGAVLPWREERADLWGERPHALGRLPGPLYQFVGSVTKSSPTAQIAICLPPSS